MSNTFTDTQNIKHQFSKNIIGYNMKLLSEIPIIDPPHNDSIQTQNEIDELIMLQKNRKADDVSHIKNQINLDNTIIKYFGITNENIANIIGEFIMSMEGLIMSIKLYHNRIRPSYLEPKLKPPIDVPDHPSFPSGHATQAYLIAEILTDKYPKNAEFNFKVARNIARNREIAGVHYPSDSEYGRKIAKIIAKFYKGINNPLNQPEVKWLSPYCESDVTCQNGTQCIEISNDLSKCLWAKQYYNSNERG